MGYYNDQDEWVYTEDDTGPGIKTGVGAALVGAAGPSPSIVAGKDTDTPEPTPAPIGGAPAPATVAAPKTNDFNIINQIAAQLQQQYEALRVQAELARTRLKVIDLPEAQSRDEQWRRNIVMQTVLNAQQAFGRALPWEFIEQQYMNLPGQGRLGESSPFKPGAGGGTAGAQPSTDEMLKGLIDAGWNTEAANAYRAGGPRPPDAEIIAAWGGVDRSVK